MRILVFGLIVLALGWTPAGVGQAATPPEATPDPLSDGGSGIPFVGQQTYLAYRQDTAPDAPVLLRQAAFVAYDDGPQRAWGNVQHRLVSEGEVVRLTPNFEADSGPSLELVLTRSERPTPAQVAASMLTLPLESAAGAQEYPVPADEPFGAVAVYDRAAGSVLALASLEPEPVCEEIPTRGALAYQIPDRAPRTCLAINRTEDLNLTGTPPREVDIDAYRLYVKGEVEQPLELTWEALKGYPSVSEVVLLICSGFFADTVEWTGVPLSAILAEAGVTPGFSSVQIASGSDGYRVTLEQKYYDWDDVILAYQVNGEDVPLAHGYPVRLVIKDEYGAKWVKWVKSIDVIP